MDPADHLNKRRPASRRRWIILAALVVVVALGGYFVTRPPATDAARGGRGGDRNRVQPVSVLEVRKADMPVWVAALGTAVPRNLVTVRSRVDGQLMKLYFREGEFVKQGQPIAEIDPRPFEVQLMQANGQLAKDAALLKNSEIDLERYQELLAQDSIARQQVDTQEALVRQNRGTLEADRGAVESAKLQLSFAHITAPASGRLGLRQVDPGNQVHASDANGIAVIAQLQPMTVVFSAPETNLQAINKRLASGDPILVEAWDRELKNRLASGVLITIDNLVDTVTGTIKLKAEFKNEDNALFPNQFVNVKLLLTTLKEATVVPGAAILRGAKGSFVYTVDADSVVHTLAVTQGPVDGDRVAIEAPTPIAAGTRVVSDGADKLREGAKVEVITPGVAAAPENAGPPGAKKRQGGGGERTRGGEKGAPATP